jgi:adenylate cyclase
LRQCLLRLRSNFEPVGLDPLVVDPQTVRINGDLVQVDAVEFLHRAQSQAPADLEQAAALYRGELLEGLVLDKEPFDTWLQAQRAEVAKAATHVLRRAAEQRDQAGDGFGAIQVGEKLVALDPVNEDAHRLLLRLLARHQGRDTALRHADTLARMVREEVGSELEAATTDLITEIRKSAPPAVAAADAAGSPEPPASHVMPPLALPDAPSIAVLPFVNMSGNTEHEYFADGITEDIITGLSRLRWLLVIARTSTFAYKSGSVDVRKVARDLGVRYVLEGSVRTSGAAGQPGAQIRITAQLIDAASGNHIWAEKYDRRLHDIFAVQDDITQHTVAAIEPHLYVAEGFRAAARPTSLDVWGLVARAITLVNKVGRQQNEEARRLLHRAIEIDPGCARAHAILSWAEWWSAHCSWNPAGRYEGLERAARYAESGLHRDPSEPWARMTYGFSLSTAGQHARALEELQAALALNPSFALGHMIHGWALMRAGSFDAAVAATGLALRLSPIDGFAGLYNATHGLTLLGARRFSEALPYLRASIVEFAEYAGHFNTLISCLGHLGLIEEAREFLAQRHQIAHRLTIGELRRHLGRFAHHQTFIEGLIKVGVPED